MSKKMIIVGMVLLALGGAGFFLTLYMSGLTISKILLSNPWELDPGIYQFTTTFAHKDSEVEIKFFTNRPVGFYIKTLAGDIVFGYYRTLDFHTAWIVPSTGHYQIWIDNTRGEKSAEGYLEMIEKRPLIDPSIIRYGYIASFIVFIIGLLITVAQKKIPHS